MSAQTNPATDCVAVTPHDTNPLPNGVCRAVRVSGAGNVVGYTPKSPSTLRTCAFLAGETRVIRFTLIHTDSTATGIEAMY
jgi:hypothetical protein